MKLGRTLLAATALALALPASLQAAEVKKIGLAVPNLQADFFNQIKIGVENYAKEKGIEVVVNELRAQGVKV